MRVSLENNHWRIFHILTSEDIDDVIYRFLHWIYNYNKKKITRWHEDMDFIFEWYFHHLKIKSISSRHRVISSLYLTSEWIE